MTLLGMLTEILTKFLQSGLLRIFRKRAVPERCLMVQRASHLLQIMQCTLNKSQSLRLLKVSTSRMIGRPLAYAKRVYSKDYVCCTFPWSLLRIPFKFQNKRCVLRVFERSLLLELSSSPVLDIRWRDVLIIKKQRRDRDCAGWIKTRKGLRCKLERILYIRYAPWRLQN